MQQNTEPDAARALPATLLRSPRTHKALHWALAGLSCLLVLFFVLAALHRLRYPFEVEWIESGMLTSVLRVAQGQGLYVAPTVDFVPYLYAPLYFYVAAALSKLMGGAAAGYAPLRLLSAIATLGSCGAIYALVTTETRRRLAGLAAAGLYVGCYQVLNGFFDIGRVDSLFVFLLLLALLAQRRGHPLLAALLWALTFQTKQTVLPLAMLILCAEWQRPRRAIAAVATFLAAAGISVLLLNHFTHGWYSFYIFEVARGLPLVARQIVLYVPSLVLAPLGIAWILVGASLAVRPPNLRSSPAMFYTFVSFALYAGTWFVEAHRGASMNAMMPVYAWTAVLFGVAFARLLDYALALKLPQVAALTLAAAAVQLLALIYNPTRFVPSPTAAAQSQAFVDRLRSVPGDVYVLNHSHDAVLAGKQPHAEGEALGAVLDAKLGDTSRNLQQQLDDAVKNHRYSMMVIDDLALTHTSWHFEQSYPLAVSTEMLTLRSITSQPQWFLLPCGAPPEDLARLTTPASTISTAACTQPTQP